ncbi:MAG: TRAM domain-containing protein [Nanoarchaeota archaeon]|nr:TRAM domain-containing protein [Nanoarchaeota archaeon]
MKGLSSVLALSVILLIATSCASYQYQPYGKTPTGNVVAEESFKVGDTLIVKIDSVSDKGQGIAKANGGTVLVPDVKKGETVKVKITSIVRGVGMGEKIDMTDEELQAQEPSPKDEGADVRAIEGELIDLKPYVNDPDGDKVTLGFTVPFDAEGRWQTKEGDAGQYSVIITATDEKGSFVTKQLTISVTSKNKAPYIKMPDTLEFNEGELVVLSPEIIDPDDKEVFVTFSGWMDTKTYQTTYDDAGEYEVEIKAADLVNSANKKIKIIIHDIDLKPELSLSANEIVVTAGDRIELKAEAKDPEGKEVSVVFSEPLDKEGVWQTAAGNEGTYIAKITATDGKNEVVQEVTINVQKKNTPPVLELVSVSPQAVELKKPGDEVSVKIEVKASDADGDKLDIKYSGYMDAAEKTVRYGDKGGVKTVTVTVSDGKDEVSQDVTFDMNNWPCFDCQN